MKDHDLHLINHVVMTFSLLVLLEKFSLLTMETEELIAKARI